MRLHYLPGTAAMRAVDLRGPRTALEEQGLPLPEFALA
jgi:hypothetical protein